jgi:hypothetical protein
MISFSARNRKRTVCCEAKFVAGENLTIDGGLSL